MSGAGDTMGRFRGSRPTTILASFIFLVSGLYSIAVYSAVINLALGVLLLTIGLVGLYNQFVGESVVATVKSKL